MAKCDGKLIKNTGISPGNYKYWSSKSDCDSFFSSKSFSSFSNYSVVRGEPTSKYGYNVACVHVDLPHSSTTECDYVSYRNSNDSRMYHAQVVDREYVNEKSTRLYFVIDYVASFFDTIKLEKCFVERSHVSDDWQFVSVLSNNKYNLSEPIDVNLVSRPDLIFADPFVEVNKQLTFSNSEYNMITSVKENGEIANPKITFQAGSVISGFLYNGTKSKIEELTNKYVTFMSKMLNKSSSMSENINSIYFTPKIVSSDREIAPVTIRIEMNYIELVQTFNLMNIKHAKTLSYLRYVIVGNTGTETLSLAEYGNNFLIEAMLTGGENGQATLVFFDKNASLTGAEVSSNNWPNIPIVSSVNKDSYSSSIGQSFKNNYDKVSEIRRNR